MNNMTIHDDQPWEPYLSDESISKEKMELAYETAKENLSFQVECFDSLSTGRNQLLAFLIAIATASAGYSLSNLASDRVWIGVVSLLYAFSQSVAAIVLAWLDLKPRRVHGRGQAPSDFLEDYRMKCDYELILLSLCIGLQQRISDFKHTNEERGFIQGVVIRFICISLPVAFFVGIVGSLATCE